MFRKVLLDTCVLVDLSVPGRPRHGKAREAVDSFSKESALYISASSLKDVYYIICKHYGDERKARDIVSGLRKAFYVAELTVPIVDDALESDEPDFEDALIRATAESLRCNLLVTADKEAFRKSTTMSIKVIK